mmetsp:Transcript_1966/g.4128  ORF Transcript_1966/g.4128 Transcript_1966/m.4128 type:complete len:223 (+) Transcript_1966:314-982(+)
MQPSQRHFSAHLPALTWHSRNQRRRSAGTEQRNGTCVIIVKRPVARSQLLVAAKYRHACAREQLCAGGVRGERRFTAAPVQPQVAVHAVCNNAPSLQGVSARLHRRARRRFLVARGGRLDVTARREGGPDAAPRQRLHRARAQQDGALPAPAVESSQHQDRGLRQPAPARHQQALDVIRQLVRVVAAAGQADRLFCHGVGHLEQAFRLRKVLREREARSVAR